VKGKIVKGRGKDARRKQHSVLEPYPNLRKRRGRGGRKTVKGSYTEVRRGEKGALREALTGTRRDEIGREGLYLGREKKVGNYKLSWKT